MSVITDIAVSQHFIPLPCFVTVRLVFTEVVHIGYIMSVTTDVQQCCCGMNNTLKDEREAYTALFTVSREFDH